MVSYTKEFNRSAVLLVVEGGYSLKEAAENLGTSSNNLSRWKSEYFSGKLDATGSVSTSMSDELKALGKENARLKQERDILKTAAVFFAKEGH